MHLNLGGLLKYSKNITLFLVPHINSYKRFQLGTLMPTKVAGSQDNRTVGFGLCGEGSDAVRVKCRICGADLNPYIAFVALVAAGLAGIDANWYRRPDCRRRLSGCELPEIPKTLRDSSDISSNSTGAGRGVGERGRRSLRARRPMGAVRI
ncbi:glutamine synthetase [Paraburkholderia kirstenboschensis]|uniref:glutamine synthetase n=2 Tax=Paraburkholderia kirstenboschensis TaxID=1245436 RepID=UPI001F48DB4B|nr:glutamine synthetase [Paraburkholderia kirstenboschensis]